MSTTALFLSLDGRISRSTYLVIGVGTRVAAVGLAALAPGGGAHAPLFLILAWISFAASVKRLHDQDRRGWWLMAEVPVAYTLYGLFLVLFQSIEPSGMVAFIVTSLVIGRAEGTKGRNRFGPPPPSFGDWAGLRGAYRPTVSLPQVTLPEMPQMPSATRTLGPVRTRVRRRGLSQMAVPVALVALSFIAMEAVR